MDVDQERMDIDEPSVRRKGRGFKSGGGERDILESAAVYDRLEEKEEVKEAGGFESKISGQAARSVEGWIVFVTGVHEEASDDDLQDKFGEYGEIKNLHLNLDRRTGYVKGYALVEYETRREAENAIRGASGTKLLDKVIKCDFAFVRPTGPQAGKSRQRGRSKSPERGKDLIDRIG
ncbi:RNA-binding domain-containing protein [Atractiella rhizophila]|nr:RNA-binding domain-containing protein [Atractiella rhizophila]